MITFYSMQALEIKTYKAGFISNLASLKFSI
jgi:hypothetical protein